jgi:hypothetical protein
LAKRGGGRFFNVYVNSILRLLIIISVGWDEVAFEPTSPPFGYIRELEQIEVVA